MHGELDYRVPLEQGLGMFTALQRRGVPSRLLVFPDEGHWVLQPANSVRWYQEVIGWIDRWMKPAGAVKAFAYAERWGHEEIVIVRDAASGLRAIIALHDTTLGPAIGGTRMRDLPVRGGRRCSTRSAWPGP